LRRATKKTEEKERLPSLSLVLGYMAVRELQSLRDRVDVLSRLGYGNSAIARICGTTANAVAVIKSRSRSGR